MCKLRHGTEWSARASNTRNSRIRKAAEEPWSGVMTGEAQGWGEWLLGGETAKGVCRGIDLATPGLCWPVCPIKVP